MPFLINIKICESHVSHDSSEIILICLFAAQDTFLIIIHVESSCAVSDFFCGNHFFINLKKHILDRILIEENIL